MVSKSQLSMLGSAVWPGCSKNNRCGHLLSALWEQQYQPSHTDMVLPESLGIPGCYLWPARESKGGERFPIVSNLVNDTQENGVNWHLGDFIWSVFLTLFTPGASMLELFIPGWSSRSLFFLSHWLGNRILSPEQEKLQTPYKSLFIALDPFYRWGSCSTERWSDSCNDCFAELHHV